MLKIKMAWKCDKCGKEFETKEKAIKHEANCEISISRELPEKIKKKLISFLHEDEKILHSFKGVWGSHQRWTDASIHSSSGILNYSGSGGQWGSPWLILTTQRAIILGKGVITLDIREIPYEHIKSLDYEQGVLQDRLMILAHSSTEAIQFYSADRKITQNIPKIIKKLMNNPQVKETRDEENPMRILKLRYAKGEITKKQFQEMEKHLE